MSGPAGTGKTESLRDFHKYLGERSFVIIQCETIQTEVIKGILDPKNLENGVKLVFDEFNKCSGDTQNYFY